jgi:mannose-1-phosphate guanylyltransferase
MKAIVLCAGFGSRLAPLTDHVPKPLVPVVNRPVLDLVLDRLQAVGIEEVGINLHHRADQIAAHLERRMAGPRPRTVREAEILDTGGGIANFRHWIEADGDDAVLVHNADVVTDIDLEAAMADHRASGADATLVLVDHPPTNLVAADASGEVRDIGGRIKMVSDTIFMLTFSGIYILSRDFLRRLQPGQKASIIDALVAALCERPGSVRAHLPRPGTYWRDLGRVGHYLDMHREILMGGAFCPPGLDVPLSGILIDPAARIEPSAKLEGFVAVGPGCHIASGVHLANCVVWSGTHLLGGFEADRAVILQDLVVAA